MKRTCTGCVALVKNVNGLGCTCELRHKIEATKELYGLPVEYKPLEECEKPKSFKELCKIPRPRRSS